MSTTKEALTPAVSNKLNAVSGPYHFMDDHGNPASMKLAKEIKELAATLKKEFFVQGSTADFLQRLINVGNVHNQKVVNPQGQSTKPYEDLVNTLRIIKSMTNVLSYEDQMVADVVQGFMMNQPANVNATVMKEIRPAYLIYTNRDCRESIVKLEQFLSSAVSSAASILANPYSTASAHILSQIDYWAKNFLLVFTHRFQARDDHQGHTEHSMVSASSITERLDKLASALQDLQLNHLAMQVDSVTNTIEQA